MKPLESVIPVEEESHDDCGHDPVSIYGNLGDMHDMTIVPDIEEEYLFPSAFRTPGGRTKIGMFGETVSTIKDVVAVFVRPLFFVTDTVIVYGLSVKPV